MLGFAYPISDLKKILSNYSTLDKQLMERLEEMDWFETTLDNINIYKEKVTEGTTIQCHTFQLTTICYKGTCKVTKVKDIEADKLIIL